MTIETLTLTTTEEVADGLSLTDYSPTLEIESDVEGYVESVEYLLGQDTDVFNTSGVERSIDITTTLESRLLLTDEKMSETNTVSMDSESSKTIDMGGGEVTYGAYLREGEEISATVDIDGASTIEFDGDQEIEFTMVFPVRTV